MYHVRTMLVVPGMARIDGQTELVEEHDVPDLTSAVRWADWARDWGMLAEYSEVEPAA